MLTYRQLLQAIQQLHEEDLDSNVSVYDANCGEYYPAEKVDVCDDGVLDDGHLFIKFNKSISLGDNCCNCDGDLYSVFVGEELRLKYTESCCSLACANAWMEK